MRRRTRAEHAATSYNIRRGAERGEEACGEKKKSERATDSSVWFNKGREKEKGGKGYLPLECCVVLSAS